MNSRLIIAFCLALLLIGGATWRRVTRASTVRALPLTAVSNPEESTSTAIESESSAEIPDSAPAASSTEKLTDTNLIARQLFGDYLDLSSKGQATPENLNSLATEYADNIAGLDKSPRITSDSLRVVANSKADFQAYGDALTIIYGKYENLKNQTLSTAATVSSSGPAYTELTQALSDMYNREASELKAMNVPVALTADHLALINMYLGDSWSMQVIGSDSTDSATAFAGAAVANQNVSGEKDIISNIEKILTQNGI